MGGNALIDTRCSCHRPHCGGCDSKDHQYDLKADLEADVYPGNYTTKRTEVKEVFASGAHRSSASGRGRPQDTSPYAMRRLYQLLERGADIYGARNYQKGMSMDRSIGSLERHVNDYKTGDTKEDHLAAIMFNAMVLIDTEERIKLGLAPKELNDYFVSTTKDGTN